MQQLHPCLSNILRHTLPTEIDEVMNPTIKKLVFILLFSGQIFSLHALHTFTGTVSNQWNHPSNWQPQSVPSLSDDVIIPNGFTGMIEIGNANASCKSITYNGSQLMLVVQSGWKILVGGSLNIQGASSITGGGIMEFTGSGNVSITIGTNANFLLGMIEIKKQGSVSLQNDLMIPYSILKVVSGTFNMQGFSVEALSVILDNNAQSKILNCQNSNLTTEKLIINLNNSSSFLASYSNLLIKELIFLSGSVQFYDVRFVPGGEMMLDGMMSYASFENIYAEGDINLLGSKQTNAKNYYISNLHLLSESAVCTFTESPFVAGYEIHQIFQSVNCHSRYMITDGNEIHGNRINLIFPNTIQLYNTAIANTKSSTGMLTIMNGVDLGNNQQIQFGNTSLQTLYWVGGQGKWNDGSHWSYTSGGIPSGCIPDFNTDVVVDAMSGFVAGDSLIITNHAFMHDIRFEQAMPAPPVFNATQKGAMHIRGGIDFRGLIYMDLNIQTNFYGHEQHILHTRNLAFGNHIAFFGTGEWIVDGLLNIAHGNKAIYHNQGTIILQSNDLIAASYSSSPTKLPMAYRNLNIVGSKMQMGNAQGYPGNFVLHSNNFDLESNHSMIYFPYQFNLTPMFQIHGNNDLQFYDLTFHNPLSQPFITMNQKCAFRKIELGANAIITNLPVANNTSATQADSLIIHGGYRVEIQNNRLIRINQGIDVLTDVCNDLAYLTSSHPVQQTTIHFAGISNDTVHNLICKNIHLNGNAPIHINNGADHQNNTNIIFDNPASSRVFYWNGEGAQPFWSQSDNWNIDVLPHAGNYNDAYLYNVNGCLPGFIDSVVFHHNSFPLNDTVFINTNSNYTGMNWMPGTGTNRVLSGSPVYQINNYGGLRYDFGLWISFSGPTRMLTSSSRTVETNQVLIPGRLIFAGVGSYYLSDDIYMPAAGIEHYSGSFFTQGHAISVKNYTANYLPFAGTQFEYNALGSVFNIYGNALFSFHHNLHTVYTDDVVLFMRHSAPALYLSGTHQQMHFKKVDYTNETGNGLLVSSFYQYPVSFEWVSFAGNGKIYGSNIFDTLIFAEGRIYELESNATQNISDILISKGTPCFRTTVQSSLPGIRAKISHPACHLDLQHARLRDIEAIDNSCLNNQYIVNVGGENLGNNINWTFIPGDPINGLGPDTIIGCKELPYPVNTNGFGSFESLVWSNGITATPYWVEQSEILQVDVTYSARCKVTDIRQITVANTISQPHSVTPVTCFGNDDGEIHWHVAGGNGQYSGSWLSQSAFIQTNDSTLSNLSSGWYQHIVTQNGFEQVCADTIFVWINQPDSMFLQALTSEVSCHNGNDGEIVIHPNGGNGSYTYVWSHDVNLNVHSANHLTAGLYQVTANDYKGCQANIEVEIFEPSALHNSFTLIPSQCAASNGQVSLETNGGTGTYTYSWSHDASFAGSVCQNLSPGQHQVVIVDDNLCSDTLFFIMYDTNFVSATFVLHQPDCFGADNGMIEIVANGGNGVYTYQYSTNGNSYNINDSATISSLTAGMYDIQVSDDNGCIYVESVQLNHPSQIVLDDIQIQMPTCFGKNNGAVEVYASGGSGNLSYFWPQFNSTNVVLNNLMAGNYLLSVTDNHNCVAEFDVLVKQPEELHLELDELHHVSCFGRNDGRVLLDIKGGTPAYSVWADGQLAQTDLIENLISGEHLIVAMDMYGCRDTIHVMIDEPEMLMVSLDTIIPGKCGVAEGLIQIDVMGGVQPYTFAWSNGVSEMNNSIAVNGSHAVTITDANRCQTMGFYQIRCVENLLIPELLTPNYDGYADQWVIHDLDRLYPNNRVQIYNRWGSLVFDMQQYDGSFRGIANTGHLPGNGYLPEATYYYVIDLGDGYDTLTGFVELDY